MWDDVRRGVFMELGSLQREVGENRELLKEAANSEPGKTEVLATSAVIHAFYGGIENVFNRIARGIDGSVPAGEKWHTDLLRAMSEPTEHRPAVVSPELHKRLTYYMYFRHVFRHIYTIDLNWDKMCSLARDCEDTLNQFVEEIEAFFADENGGS